MSGEIHEWMNEFMRITETNIVHMVAIRLFVRLYQCMHNFKRIYRREWKFLFSTIFLSMSGIIRKLGTDTNFKLSKVNGLRKLVFSTSISLLQNFDDCTSGYPSRWPIFSKCCGINEVNGGELKGESTIELKAPIPSAA